MKNILIALATAATILLAAPAFADNKSVSHNIELSGINHIEIQHSVGNVRIERAQESNITAMAQLTGTIKAGNKRWFRRSEDLANINFDISTRGDTLYIVFEHDNAEADFVLTIPAVESLSVKLGVGNLVAILADQDTNVKVGVGNADLTAQLESIGAISLNTGVGDTRVTGTNQQNTTRAIVTSKVQASGQGSHPVEVKVGVGNASLDLLG